MKQTTPPVKREPFKGTIKDGTKIELPIPAMSATIAEMYVKCPRQWWFRHVLGLRLPPAIVMVAGTSGHKALETNNLHKMKHGEDMKPKKVLGVFSDVWATLRKEIPQSDWAREQTSPDQIEAEVRTPLDDYMKHTAATIRPAAAEQRFETTFGGVPVVGTIDLVTEDKRVHDYKVCGARSPYLKGMYADQSLQLGVYAAATKAERAGYIALVKGGKVAKVATSTPKQRRVSAREEVVQIAKGISAGSFPMCPVGSWYCAPKWCGYHHLCRGARGKPKAP